MLCYIKMFFLRFIVVILAPGVINGLTSEDGYLAWDVKTSPLQLYADGKSWQTICLEGIDMTVAHVVCRQQGKISATALKEATEQEVTDTVYSSVKCSPVSNYTLYGETNIMRCSISAPVLKTSVSCTAASVDCHDDSIRDTNPYEGQVFLEREDTATPADGTLQVYRDGAWQYVCSTEDFTKVVADSICRQYGYTGSLFYNKLISSESGLVFSDYSCISSTNSFACFTHCTPSTYDISSKCHRITIKCRFDVNETYITSGSRSQCSLESCSHDESLYHSYRIATFVEGGALASLLLIFVVLIVRHCYKKFGCCCCKKTEPRQLRARYGAGGDDLPNDAAHLIVPNDGDH